MFIPSEKLRKTAECCALENQEGFSDLVDFMSLQMQDRADKGYFDYSVEINMLVEKFMSKSTTYLEVSSKLKELLEENGYKVTPYSNYKEENLRITW